LINQPLVIILKTDNQPIITVNKQCWKAADHLLPWTLHGTWVKQQSQTTISHRSKNVAAIVGGDAINSHALVCSVQSPSLLIPELIKDTIIFLMPLQPW